jgi:hypothetical protein
MGKLLGGFIVAFFSFFAIGFALGKYQSPRWETQAAAQAYLAQQTLQQTTGRLIPVRTLRASCGTYRYSYDIASKAIQATDDDTLPLFEPRRSKVPDAIAILGLSAGTRSGVEVALSPRRMTPTQKGLNVLAMLVGFGIGVDLGFDDTPDCEALHRHLNRRYAWRELAKSSGLERRLAVSDSLMSASLSSKLWRRVAIGRLPPTTSWQP